MNRGDFLTPVLAVGVVPVSIHAHRAGAVQGQGGHDVFEAGRLHALEQLLHTAGVQLEHAQGIPAREQVIDLGDLGVIGMQLLELHFFAAVALNVFDGIANNGEVAQAQKVHLQQANGLAGGVIPAGDIGAIGRPLPHRDVVHQPHGSHNHRAGVHAGLADDAFQTARGVINLFHIRVGFHHLADLGGLGIALVVGVSNAPQRDILRHNRRRQRTIDAVSHLEAGLAKVHLGGVLNGLLGFHRAEGNDLGYLILSPALGGVGNHLAAAAIVEVDIDIGGGRALGVQKALEEQVVFQRINIGNGQRVGHERARRRTTAGPYTDAYRTRVLN